VSTLDPSLARALDELAARRPLLLASDYDGVLARLRDDPAAAVPEDGIVDRLGRLAGAEGVTVALVSGRGVEDLQRTSGITGPFRWIGSHGAEFDGPLAGELRAARDELAAALAPLVEAVPGARLEVKPAAVAVHVRTVADREAGRALLERAAAAGGPHSTAKPGKDVLELAVTDADGFRALGSGDVTVKIGDGETAAAHRLPDLSDVPALLDRLVSALSA
jgi:trehalose 6-phosphate phosphatase